MIASEKSALERIAREYQEPDPGRKVDQKTIAWTAERIIPWIRGPEVLELGFGDDQWTAGIIARFGHSHLVDGSTSLLAAAKEKYGSKVCIYASLFEEFQPEKRFDTILASFVLEHVADPVQVLKMARGWIKQSGQIIIIVPNANSLHRRLAVAMGLQKSTDALGPTDQRLGHRRVYSVLRMEQDIRDAGLRVARKRGMFLKPLPQGMMADFSDAMLNGLMKLGDELPLEFASSIAFECEAAAAPVNGRQ